MDNFKKKFVEEATDNINDLENALLEIDKNPDDEALIEQIFRALHSLKGGGAMFGFEHISSITHELENIYELIRQGKRKNNEEIISVTLSSVDHLRNLLADAELNDENNRTVHAELETRIENLGNSVNAEKKEEEEAEAEPLESNTFYILFQPNADILKNGTNPLYLIDELQELGQCIVVAHTSKIPEFAELNPTDCLIYWEVYLCTAEKIDAIQEVFIFVEDESNIDIQLVANRDLISSNEIKPTVAKAIGENQRFTFNAVKSALTQKQSAQKNKNGLKKDQLISSIRVSSDKLDHMMNLVSEMVTTQARLSLYAENSELADLTSIAENVQKLTRQLRDIAFSIVLIPISTVIMRFQRLVRDLSKNLNKKIDFITEGTDTELDKTIIESLVDPLMHIIRNSIDHGLETIPERIKAGKPEVGTIKLSAYYSGANVHIDISDDGAGINKDKVLQKAIDKELVSPEVQLSDKEIYNLLFLPGFSTASKVTDVSGRGVGMDVVSKKINEIRGDVTIDSEKGKGTTISIIIPLTLSIIDGLLVKISGHYFILPLAVVDKIFAIKHSDIYSSTNDLLVLDGEQTPFINLRKKLKINGDAPESEEVVVANFDGIKVGLILDSVVGEYQAVLKPLGKQFKKLDYISGASILGDGKIAFVLDTNKLITALSKSKHELVE